MKDSQIITKLRKNAQKDPLAAQILRKINNGKHTAQEGWAIYSKATVNNGDI